MNIVILTGKFGMGHISVSTTIYNKIKKDYPNANIYILDFFEILAPSGYDRIYRFYAWLVDNMPMVYNSYYKLTDNSKKTIKPFMVHNLYTVMKRVISEYSPDVVISTLPIATQTAGFYKRKYNESYKLITCITDISFHTEWINKNCDYYLVGSEEVKNNLKSFEIDENKIIVTGIPVKEEFFREYKFNNSDSKRILIMGGGLGLIPEDESFYKKLNQLHNTKTTIILGNNRQAYEKLYGKYENIEIIGYTSEVYKYLGQADILVSKPGGITTYEAITMQKPMLVLNPFLAQEFKNAKFIEKNNFGKVIWDKKADLNFEIENFLENKDNLKNISKNMHEFKLKMDTTAIIKILDNIQVKTKVAVNKVPAKVMAVNM